MVERTPEAETITNGDEAKIVETTVETTVVKASKMEVRADKSDGRTIEKYSE